MSVLTFQLTKMGFSGYELDYDHAIRYYEPQNYNHSSGRVQRVEEADHDWKATYDAVQNDLIIQTTKRVHDYTRWEDVDEPCFEVGAMRMLEGHELAMECIRKICESFDAKYIGEDRKYVNDFRSAISRAAANMIANQKLGMSLPTSRLIELRCRYCLMRVAGDRVDEALTDLIMAVKQHFQKGEM